MLELPAWWFEDDEWRGFVLCGHRTDLLDQHVFATYLAGFKHRAETARKASFDPGRQLNLVPEPDNPFDEDAVAVLDSDGREQAGFIPEIIAEGLGKVGRRYGVSLAEHLMDGERVGLVIAVSRVPISLRRLVPADRSDRERLLHEVRQSKRQFSRAMKRQWTPPGGDPVEEMWRTLEEMERRPE